MKKNLYGFILLLFLFASCSTTRNSIANTQEDIALITEIKKIDKNPSDTILQNKLNSLYENAAKIHLDNIDNYSTLAGPEKWWKIIKEYQALQHLSGVINSSANAKKFLRTKFCGRTNSKLWPSIRIMAIWMWRFQVPV